MFLQRESEFYNHFPHPGVFIGDSFSKRKDWFHTGVHL